MAGDEFAEQSVYYDKGYNDLESMPNGFPDLKIVDYNKNVTNKNILSIGGGNCADIWFLTKHNQVASVDASLVGVELAKKHGVNSVLGDVSSGLPFSDKLFDVVILKDILEHIYNPIILLEESKRVLKDDGYIILSLPNHFYWPFRMKMLFGGNMIWKTMLHNHKNDFEEWNYMHIRFFTWAGVKKMVKLNGLKVDKAYWDFGTLAHYSDPAMYEYAFKVNNKKITNQRQWVMYKLLLPLFNLFSFVFPRKLRGYIVSIAPGLLCAGFYVRLKKNI